MLAPWRSLSPNGNGASFHQQVVADVVARPQIDDLCLLPFDLQSPLVHPCGDVFLRIFNPVHLSRHGRTPSAGRELRSTFGFFLFAAGTIRGPDASLVPLH